MDLAAHTRKTLFANSAIWLQDQCHKVY